jgi:hypothetical protein
MGGEPPICFRSASERSGRSADGWVGRERNDRFRSRDTEELALRLQDVLATIDPLLPFSVLSWLR